MTARTFVIQDSRKMEHHPKCWKGIIGPTTAGKTVSALRVAKGAVEVLGGHIAVIETERGKASHYRGEFQFQHVDFQPPHHPLDLVDALRAVLENGAGVAVVDCMSAVWNWCTTEHANLCREMGNKKRENPDKYSQLMWTKVKPVLRQMEIELHTLDPAKMLIFTFATKDDPNVDDRKSLARFLPVFEARFMYELTTTCLVVPGTYGAPAWANKTNGGMFQSRKYLSNGYGEQLDEETGRALARWMRGGKCHREQGI